jgi:transposase, IS5 family
MLKRLISLFAEQERKARRAKLGDPLVGLAEHMDFDVLAAHIHTAGFFARPDRPSAKPDDL